MIGRVSGGEKRARSHQPDDAGSKGAKQCASYFRPVSSLSYGCFSPHSPSSRSVFTRVPERILGCHSVSNLGKERSPLPPVRPTSSISTTRPHIRSSSASVSQGSPFPSKYCLSPPSLRRRFQGELPHPHARRTPGRRVISSVCNCMLNERRDGSTTRCSDAREPKIRLYTNISTVLGPSRPIRHAAPRPNPVSSVRGGRPSGPCPCRPIS